MKKSSVNSRHVFTGVDWSDAWMIDLLRRLKPHRDALGTAFVQALTEESLAIDRDGTFHGTHKSRHGIGLHMEDRGVHWVASTVDLTKDSIQSAAIVLRGLGGNRFAGQTSKSTHPSSAAGVNENYAGTNTDIESMKSLVDKLQQTVRRLESNCSIVLCGVRRQHNHVLVVADNGLVAGDVRLATELWVEVAIPTSHGKLCWGFAGDGCRDELETLNEKMHGVAARAVAMARNLTVASPGLTGRFPVVFGPGITAMLFHEAVGHGVESDAIAGSGSPYAGKLGQVVASPHVTLVDDGSIAGLRGSAEIDDTGFATRKNVIIENGVLKQYIGTKCRQGTVGNMRRQSFKHRALPRMTNTFLLPGQYNSKEIIESVDRGLYVTSMLGGNVDPISGKFFIPLCEAWLIERGRIIHPVKATSINGLGASALRAISMIGDDFAFSSNTCSCTKGKQIVPISVGQPTIRVNDVNVVSSVASR